MYPCLLLPIRGPFKTTWDVFVGIFVLYSSFVSPVDIAFVFDDVTKAVLMVKI